MRLRVSASVCWVCPHQVLLHFGVRVRVRERELHLGAVRRKGEVPGQLEATPFTAGLVELHWLLQSHPRAFAALLLQLLGFLYK